MASPYRNLATAPIDKTIEWEDTDCSCASIEDLVVEVIEAADEDERVAWGTRLYSAIDALRKVHTK